MREFLDENNGENVKIIAKVRQGCFGILCNLEEPTRQNSLQNTVHIHTGLA